MESNLPNSELYSEEEINSLFNRYIIHIDMDAYFAQVEMKLHRIPESQPMAVVAWKSIVAMNYKAKHAGVKRMSQVYDALAVCPDIVFVHMATVGEDKGEEVLTPSSILKVKRLDSGLENC